MFHEYCRFVIRESTKITNIICLTSAIVDSYSTAASTYLKMLIACKQIFESAGYCYFVLIGSRAILC